MARNACPECGRPLDVHNRHVRFRLPDPVAAIGAQGLPDGSWMSHEDPTTSVMMQVPNVGPFVRCLLPVHLTGGYSVTFGVWLAVPPEDLQRAFRIWWEPEYRDLVLGGYLGNTLPVWQLLGAPATADVRDVNETPYVTGSSDGALLRVLSEEWPHEELLAALPE